MNYKNDVEAIDAFVVKYKELKCRNRQSNCWTKRHGKKCFNFYFL
jgi:hypothetical protein